MLGQWLAAGGAAIFFLLGALHLRLTVRDLKNPQHFVPARRELLDDLKATRINLTKDAKDFWTSLIGFHFSHSVGVMFYAAVVAYCALVRPDILSDMTVRLGIVIVGGAYVLMARAFWFKIPFFGAGIGVTLVAVGFSLLY